MRRFPLQPFIHFRRWPALLLAACVGIGFAAFVGEASLEVEMVEVELADEATLRGESETRVQQLAPWGPVWNLTAPLRPVMALLVCNGAGRSEHARRNGIGCPLTT